MITWLLTASFFFLAGMGNAVVGEQSTISDEGISVSIGVALFALIVFVFTLSVTIYRLF